jgi:hypothetical protein
MQGAPAFHRVRRYRDGASNILDGNPTIVNARAILAEETAGPRIPYLVPE